MLRGSRYLCEQSLVVAGLPEHWQARASRFASALTGRYMGGQLLICRESWRRGTYRYLDSLGGHSIYGSWLFWAAHWELYVVWTSRLETNLCWCIKNAADKIRRIQCLTLQQGGGAGWRNRVGEQGGGTEAWWVTQQNYYISWPCQTSGCSAKWTPSCIVNYCRYSPNMH